jgi:competence protein ComGC
MAENNMNGLQIALGNKTVRATGLIALILVLSVGPILLTLFVNYKLVDAMGSMGKEFSSAIKTTTEAQNLKHDDLKKDSDAIHHEVAVKHDQILEVLGENLYILSLTDNEKAHLKLMMPSSLCKKLQRRDC